MPRTSITHPLDRHQDAIPLESTWLKYRDAIETMDTGRGETITIGGGKGMLAGAAGRMRQGALERAKSILGLSAWLPQSRHRLFLGFAGSLLVCGTPLPATTHFAAA